jgi:hypothetical protein
MTSRILQQFQKLPQKSLSLHSVFVNLRCPPWLITTPPREVTFFKRIRKLDRLALREVSVDPLLFPVCFDPAILHLHTVVDVGICRLWAYLERCSALEDLSIVDYRQLDRMDDDSAALDPSRTKLFPGLTTLTLRRVPRDFIRKFYLGAVAPALRSIDVDEASEHNPILFITFLDRSFQDRTSSLSLDRMELRNWKININQELFRTIPPYIIRNLYITKSVLQNDALIQLTPGANCCGIASSCGHYGCPDLSELHLVDVACSYALLATMVEKRAAAGYTASHMRVVDVKRGYPIFSEGESGNPHVGVEDAGERVKSCGATGAWDWTLFGPSH